MDRNEFRPEKPSCHTNLGIIQLLSQHATSTVLRLFSILNVTLVPFFNASPMHANNIPHRMLSSRYFHQKPTALRTVGEVLRIAHFDTAFIFRVTSSSSLGNNRLVDRSTKLFRYVVFSIMKRDEATTVFFLPPSAPPASPCYQLDRRIELEARRSPVGASLSPGALHGRLASLTPIYYRCIVPVFDIFFTSTD